MSAPIPLDTPEDFEITRDGLLAAAGVALVTCAVAVTLAVAGAADTPKRETAKLDAATPNNAHGVMERRR